MKCNVDISIIIPIYKGKKYVQSWLDKLSIMFNEYYLKKGETCEVVFVNDYPEEKIEIPDVWKNKINFQMVNLLKNAGIHNARIQGLVKSKGNYIVFLDQDDEISNDYIFSQRNLIGDKDAVLCNGYKVDFYGGIKEKFYSDINIQRMAVNLDFILNNGCYIVSPGQVMIRKEAIPSIWTDEVMKNGGADDFFLWIAMISENRTFALNEELLFSHIETGSNTSNNRRKIFDSLREVYRIVSDFHVLNELQKNSFKKWIEENYNYEKRMRSFRIMHTLTLWMHLKNRGFLIERHLLNKNINSIIIYGMGGVGTLLYEELKESKVKVLYAIDKKDLVSTIPIYKITELNDEEIRKADIIIITADDAFGEIKEQLENSFLEIKVNIFAEILAEAACDLI